MDRMTQRATCASHPAGPRRTCDVVRSHSDSAPWLGPRGSSLNLLSLEAQIERSSAVAWRQAARACAEDVAGHKELDQNKTKRLSRIAGR